MWIFTKSPIAEEALSDQVEKMSALWTLASLFPQALEDLVMNQVAKATGVELMH